MQSCSEHFETDQLLLFLFQVVTRSKASNENNYPHFYFYNRLLAVETKDDETNDCIIIDEDYQYLKLN